MKILISACYFTPDPIGGGKFTGEMAEWLAVKGHDVRAVVGVPFYPQWQVAEGYSGSRYQRETVRGVDLMRCPVYVPRSQSGMKRLLQLVLFAAASAPVLLGWAWRWKPDLVWTMLPPTAGLPAALLASHFAHAPSWVHVQDFEVDAAFELGLLRSPAVRRFFLNLERRLLSCFDVVSSITPRMVTRLEAKGVAASKILFPNWVDLDAIYPMPDSGALRDELAIPHNQFVALYSGNLGEKQGVDDLVDVARMLSRRPDFKMVICGDGAGRERLSQRAAGLDNLLFLPLQPMEKFNALLNLANVHLLPQKREVADLVMPSKLPGMLASGRPVIAGAMPGTQLAQEVEGCGIVVPPGDVAAMAASVVDLMSDAGRCAALGAVAHARAAQRWSKDAILANFERDITALVNRGA